MVKIKRGDHTLTVTMGAYKHLYKAMGYTLAGAETACEGVSAPDGVTTTHKPQKARTEASAARDDVSEYEEAEEEYELSEKPLSEMTFKELKSYAEYLGLKTNGVSGKKELRVMIRKREEQL